MITNSKMALDAKFHKATSSSTVSKATGVDDVTIDRDLDRRRFIRRIIISIGTTFASNGITFSVKSDSTAVAELELGATASGKHIKNFQRGEAIIDAGDPMVVDQDVSTGAGTYDYQVEWEYADDDSLLG